MENNLPFLKYKEQSDMRTARRISQLFFFLLFVFLFFQARYPYETRLPSDLFLRSSVLIAITTFFSSRIFPPTMILSFFILLLTIPFGRFFCGWICPLGTTIDITDKLFKNKKSHLNKITIFKSWKFFILVFLIITSLFSLQLVWFFDPIALFSRTFTLVIYPIIVFILFGIFTTLFSIGIFEDQIYTFYDFAQQTVLPVNQPLFYQSILVFCLFLAIIFLGFFSRRFWCCNLCPLGALLGIFSKFRLVKRKVADSCTKCARCQRDCRMKAIEDDYRKSNCVECIECGECVSVCPPKSISYGFGKNAGRNKIDISKRRFFQGIIAGVAGLALVKTAKSKNYNLGKIIRPPGSIQEDSFLDKCIRCQECVKICSSTGACLQPALLESNWEGLWSPVVVPRIGYCEYNCNLCGKVCPTGAIIDLALEDKQKVKIGQAYFDKSRCIPWAAQKDCLVCEEHCPTFDKAIKFDIREARGPDGEYCLIKFPYVDEVLCIGCGICENKCPVVGKPGIFVTSFGNVRVIKSESK